MKRELLYLLATAITICANAQITTYDIYDNEEDPVFEVEDMSPSEIKSYNNFTGRGMSQDVALMYINAGRAYDNLISAPATIIDYGFKPEITEEDSIPEALGAIGVLVSLVNSSTKTIKEIALEFEFENNGSQVYDIKTGEKYCVLKFSNLKGRTKSKKYDDIADNVLNCVYFLDLKKASYKTLFYNKKATTIKLHSAKIKYTDGSVSNKIAVWADRSPWGKSELYDDGPLSPIVKYLRHHMKYNK